MLALVVAAELEPAVEAPVVVQQHAAEPASTTNALPVTWPGV